MSLKYQILLLIDGLGIDVVRIESKVLPRKKLHFLKADINSVILDEADSMTSVHSKPLRRTMEIYSSTTRFAFACNHRIKSSNRFSLDVPF